MYRFDSDPPFGPVYWEPSTNGTGAISPAARMEIMTKRALTAERLRVRMWKSDDTPVDLEFSLNGFAEGIRKLPCASGVVTDSLP